ncbi:hypothetical protein ABPG74_004452 [Tetrahymena malaccensis]
MNTITNYFQKENNKEQPHIDKTYQSFTLKRKYEVIQKLKNGITVSNVADEFGLERKQVSNYRDQEEEIAEAINKVQKNSNLTYRISGNNKDLKYKEIKNYMLECILIRSEFPHTDCRLSNGFLENFFKRHNLAYEEQIKQLLKYPNRKQWCNMDETRLEIDIRENITITAVGANSVKIMKSIDGEKQSYTVILSGTNSGFKLPPMIYINRSGKQLLKNLDPLNCVIWFNKTKNSSYNTQEGFKYWIDYVYLKFLNEQNKKQMEQKSQQLKNNQNQQQINEENVKQNYLLFLDTATKIYIEYKPEEINYKFFKPNITHLIQPMDLSVIQKFKQKVKQKQEEQYSNNKFISESGYFKKMDRQSFIEIVPEQKYISKIEMEIEEVSQHLSQLEIRNDKLEHDTIEE